MEKLFILLFARFFENQPIEICGHFSENTSKGRILGPGKLQNHTNELKEKERRKRMSEKKDRRKREKSNGCTLRFYVGYFGEKKNVALKRSICR